MLVAIFLSNGSSFIGMQPIEDLEVRNFNFEQDASQVESMLQQNCSELFASKEFNIWNMLSYKTIKPQAIDSHNSLIMQVLKYKNEVLSFVAYEKTHPTAFIRLLVTASHERRNGYASILLSHVLDTMVNKKFKNVTIETREQNAPAVAFYEKLFKSRKDINYSKMPVLVPRKDVTDVIRYEITFT